MCCQILVYSGEMQKDSFFNDDTRDAHTHGHTRWRTHAGRHAGTRTHATNKINNTKQTF